MSPDGRPPDGRPPDERPERVTAILGDWQGDPAGALERLIPLVFGDLRRLAAYHFRGEASGHTLQPTAVVHEVYLRLLGSRLPGIRTRKEFFSVASRLIRQVLVDHARAKHADRRGGGRAPVRLEAAGGTAAAPAALEPAMVLAVHEALDRLRDRDPRQARLVELRWFTGLSVPEAAEVLEVSRATAERDWAHARRWLARELASR